MNPASLDMLREIHLPPEPALWQQPPFWLGATLLAALMGWYMVRFVRRRRLRAALRDLARMAAQHAGSGDATALSCGLSQLLRGYATAGFPQADVPGMIGSAWLDFLDAHGGGGEFNHGAGAVLESRPYQQRGPIEAAALIALTRRWLQQNPR